MAEASRIMNSHRVNPKSACFMVNGCSRTFVSVQRFKAINTCETRRMRSINVLRDGHGSSDSFAYPTGKRKSDTRVFADTRFKSGDVISLPQEEFKHLRALRFKDGEEFIVFNEAGESARASLQRKSAVVLEARDKLSPCQAQFSALVAIPKSGSKSDCIVEKLTELGANSITFMRTKRTIATAPSANKLERWKRIAIAASKQSLRDVPPSTAYVDFSSAVNVVKRHRLPFLLCSEGDLLLSSSCQTRIVKEKQAMVIIGPEGGFELSEVRQLTEAGAIPASLGSNRLRIETAAIVSTALVSQVLYTTLIREDGPSNKHQCQT